MGILIHSRNKHINHNIIRHKARLEMCIRDSAIGKHDIAAGSSAQAIYKKLIVEPLERIGMGILDIDKFAVELHNPCLLYTSRCV